jgi:hypothetical protein
MGSQRAETSRDAAKREEPDALPTAADDVSQHPKPDPDEALRAAIRAALDAGDLDRVTALVDILRASPKPAPVLELAGRKGRSRP